MTQLPRKAQHISHHYCIPTYAGATVRRRTPVECQSYDNFAARGNQSFYGCGMLFRKTRQTSHCAALQPMRDARGNRSQHCAAALVVRSTVLRGGRVAPWEPNQARGGCRRQGERREIFFLDTWGEKIFLHSGASASHCSASTSLGLRSRNVSAPILIKSPTAQCALPISTSRARRRLPMKRSWSCSTSCGRASGLKIPCESNQRQNGEHGHQQKQARVIGVASRSVVGRSATATSEIMDVTGGESAALISIPTTALGMWGDAPRADALRLDVSTAGVDTPSIHQPSLEGRGPAEDRTGGCLAARAVIYPARRGASYRAFEIPAAGYAALERGPRNPRTLITGSGAGLANSRRAA